MVIEAIKRDWESKTPSQKITYGGLFTAALLGIGVALTIGVEGEKESYKYQVSQLQPHTVLISRGYAFSYEDKRLQQILDEINVRCTRTSSLPQVGDKGMTELPIDTQVQDCTSLLDLPEVTPLRSINS